MYARLHADSIENQAKATAVPKTTSPYTLQGERSATFGQKGVEISFG